MSAKHGEVVRFYLTDTANTRVFKVGVAGARMKLVGGDSGHHEREEMVEDVILAPSERVVVDVLFDQPGEATLEHRTPERIYPLAEPSPSRRSAAEPQLEAEYESAARERGHVSRAGADRSLPRGRARQDARVRRRDGRDRAPRRSRGTAIYACPMHADIVATWAGQVPEVRDEAHACAGRDRASDRVRLPDAPRDHGDLGGRVPEVRHDVAADRGRQRDGRARSARASRRGAHARCRRRDRVGRRHGRDEPDDDAGQHALADRRPGNRRRERRDRLAVPASATRSRSGSSTRWTPTIRCITRSTSTARAASSSSAEMAPSSPTSSGRTPCSSAPARPWTSSWT